MLSSSSEKPFFASDLCAILTNVVLIAPLEPDSQIVVLDDHSLELLEQLFGLARVQLVDIVR